MTNEVPKRHEFLKLHFHLFIDYILSFRKFKKLGVVSASCWNSHIASFQ